ncbi:putative tRNA(Ile)-lysidine synthase [Curvularia clavata]|uniref:tRNA(Ile)-lysidine synthetase n=1 Tax=Curvularia clavata TaxID=95742 RepID=A0A9Q8Z1G7_CURCL|nr:putative tRNA(Ile)-lysidine synthase [Curvularia clavata]
MRALGGGLLDEVPGTFSHKQALGIAISGGVDSMALAALYKEFQQENSFAPKAYGFIVDHKVRPESTEEASWVAEQLRSKLGIESTVIPLTWPSDFDPHDRKRFETEARTLRYQALGRACRDMRINRLMVAHHADDQAETVMMRMANNRLRSGLQAMQRKEWIPECEGIYGVYHSGSPLKPTPSLRIPFAIEQGGTQILRPLLGFEKARLIATCEEKGIAWAEDKTNQIQTLTSRNAIRHIYKNHKLPEALGVRSLVDVSLHMQERVKKHKELGKKLFEKCLIKLDIQTGSLIVRFPPFSDLLPRPIETTSDRIEAKNTAYCLLERVAELVTPRAKAPLGQLAATVHRIYPELEELEDDDAGHWNGIRKKNFSVYSVWWRFWDQPTPFPEHKEHGINLSLPHPREWLLTRQPLDMNERKDAANYIVYPPCAGARPSRSDTYRLFDGRYWIRLHNLLQKDNLILRIFTKADTHHLPTYQQNRDDMLDATRTRPYRFILAALDLVQPSDVRYTLPAVFRQDHLTGLETLVGFPTLDVRVDGFGAPEGVCEWSVRYKKIEFGDRAVGETVAAGLSRKDVVFEEKKQVAVQVGVQNARSKRKKQREEGGGGGEVGVGGERVVGHVDGRRRGRQSLK